MIKKICIFIMALMCLICLLRCSVLKEMKEELVKLNLFLTTN